MKRYTHIALLATAMFVGSAVQAGPLDELKAAREGLVKAKIKVSASEQMLKDTFEKINSTVVVKVGDIKDKNIKPQIKEMDGIIDGLNEMVVWGINLAPIVKPMLCINDLVPTLKFIKEKPLATLSHTLEAIHTNFKGANDQLNPETDPQKVYANLKGAYEKFDSAVKQLDALLAAMAAM